jgi:uncharacterized membrane protein (UPF0127 family)
MSRTKKMTLILFVAVLILFIIAIGIWWRVYFGTVNPPLTRTNVSVTSSSALTDATGSPDAATVAAAAGAATNSAENPPLATEGLTIDNTTFNVEVASTSLEQTRGLSFRTSLGPDDGMLFIFSTGTVQTFWMKDMNFALDMIWISGDTVAGFTQNVPAPAPGAQLWELPIYPSPANTDKVLEVSAGTVARYNIKVGDSITIGGGQ